MGKTQIQQAIEHAKSIYGAKLTCTNGNARNGISGSRIGVHYGCHSEYIDIPRRHGWKYVAQYPGGKYSKEALKLLQKFFGVDTDNQQE